MQSSYSNAPTRAVAGMLADNGEDCHIEVLPAGEAIPFGCAVEVNSSGLVVLPKSTTLGKVAGVSVRKVTIEASYPFTAGAQSYAAGEMVRVLRKGKVWMKFNGGTITNYKSGALKHASDDTAGNAQYRGFATASATSTTGGAEVSAAPGLMFTESTNLPSGLALVEVNSPSNVGS